MASTLSRNAVIDARPSYLRQTSKSADASSNITPKCLDYSDYQGCKASSPDRRRIWGCTGREGWCTPTADQARLETYMSQNSGQMRGKRGVILGVANNRSIAWGIAKACHAAGAEIALTYQGDALKKRVEPLAAEIGALLLGHCDVTDAATIDAVFDELKAKWGKIDFVVHAIAFSDKNELEGRYVDTSAENFSKSM